MNKSKIDLFILYLYNRINGIIKAMPEWLIGRSRKNSCGPFSVWASWAGFNNIIN